jgi:hypothetical protein
MTDASRFATRLLRAEAAHDVDVVRGLATRCVHAGVHQATRLYVVR